jgi:hypothetical protein
MTGRDVDRVVDADVVVGTVAVGCRGRARAEVERDGADGGHACER